MSARNDLIAIVTGRGKWCDWDDRPGVQFVMAYPHPTKPRWVEFVVWEGTPSMYLFPFWIDGYDDGVCVLPEYALGTMEQLVADAEAWVEAA